MTIFVFNMKNLKFTIAYKGTAYNGYQSQPDKNTVQDNMEKTLALLLNQQVSINGCSRTDAGVHAREFVFNVKYDEALSGIDINSIIKGANGLLPNDIAVLSCKEASGDFHARFDCKGKEYLYLIDNSKIKNVFTRDLAFWYPYEINTEKMTEAAKIIIGEHNFGAFCKAEAKQHLKSTVRTVYDIRIEKKDNFIMIYVSGNGFLHNMVRIIAGTLIYVNEDKLSLNDIKKAIETANREYAGKTLSPCGLYLNKVFY